MNTRLPFGTITEPIANRASVDEPLWTGGVYVSDVFYWSVAKEYVFHVALPVTLPADRHFSLILSRSAASLAPIIEEQKLPTGWAATVMDRKGVVIASSGGEKPGTPSRFAGVSPDTFQPVSVEVAGTENVVAVRRSFDTGWRVVAFVPASVLEAPLQASLALLLLAAAVLLALTVLLAIYFARRVSRPIMALADRAQALGHGEPIEILNSPIREANEVSRALVDAAAERKRSEDQIRFLMRELSHRAKNQLAVVVAMARRTGGDNETLRDFRSVFAERLLALARSTDLLVEQNWKGVPIAELIDAQLRPFQSGEESRVTLEGPRIDLSADAAQNLGLALHELATNASKYGALSSAGGSVAIRWLITQPGRFRINWTERGGPPVSVPAEAGFGSQVIQRTVAQALNGEVTHDFPQEGVVWTLEVALAEIAAPR
jgi:two-component sensor histidine kinase